MSFFPSPASIKRSRVDNEDHSSPGKRCRTLDLFQASREPTTTAPPPPPTPNFQTTLAQQQQRALERMEFGAREREDVDMDMEMDGNMSDASSHSNPNHPWNTAPRMVHQLSSTSLSASSAASSSLPGTPLDYPDNYNLGALPIASTSQASHPFPSHSNPTAFIDMNGTMHVFSSSPPLSIYPPPSTPAADEHANPMDTTPTTAGGFSHGYVAQAYAHSQALAQGKQTTLSGVVRIDGMAEEGMGIIRQLDMPSYGWDVPKQASTLGMGMHLV
ncbi:hypothetical protein JCM5296_000625 [Sporobolomyces johnsonii]